MIFYVRKKYGKNSSNITKYQSPCVVSLLKDIKSEGDLDKIINVRNYRGAVIYQTEEIEW